MKFHDTKIIGLKRVSIERHEDERGSFGRTHSREEFEARGLAGLFVQSSSSRTLRAGSLRGMHMQLPPYGEAKLVRCVRGTIHDVVCDLRIGSPTYMQTQSFQLGQNDDDMLYIPTGCAHGFQTLVDDVEVLYAMSCAHRSEAAVGLRHDDPALGIDWPLAVACISPKDLGWEDYRSAPWRSSIRLAGSASPADEATGGAA